MNLSRIFPALADNDGNTEGGRIGTVDAPVFLSLADHPRALTGSDALRSTQSKFARLKLVGEAAGDVILPNNDRASRRAQAAAQRRARRRGQRAFVRDSLAREAEINTLATLFEQADRRSKKKLPARAHLAKQRAKDALARRVKSLVDQDQARYDREIAARQADRSLPAPAKPVGHTEFTNRLRALAGEAPAVVSGSAAVKARRAQKAAVSA